MYWAENSGSRTGRSIFDAEEGAGLDFWDPEAAQGEAHTSWVGLNW